MAKAQAQEPSMEEILASIRRIIADDEPKPAAKAAAPVAPPAPPPAETVSEDDLDKLFAKAGADEDPADDVLDLDEDLIDGPDLVETVPFEEQDVAFDDPPPPPPPPVAKVVQPEPVRVEPPRPEPIRAEAPRAEPRRPPIDTEPLLGRATDMAVQSAFNNLALTIMSNQARTLEDLVQDMLRPMLKTWLDDNLPTMVERLVRAEIERVSRGR